MAPSHRTTITNYRSKWNKLSSMYGSDCAYCHEVPATQIDHVVPYSLYPCHDFNNLVLSCGWCNLLASDKVFPGFEEKYDYIASRRAVKENRRGRRLTCANCFMPYDATQAGRGRGSRLYCPHCRMLEYATSTPQKKRRTMINIGNLLQMDPENVVLSYASASKSEYKKSKVWPEWYKTLMMSGYDFRPNVELGVELWRISPATYGKIDKIVMINTLAEKWIEAGDMSIIRDIIRGDNHEQYKENLKHQAASKGRVRAHA